MIAFALAIEERLSARDERNPRGWIGMPYCWLMQRLRHELYALQSCVDVLEVESQLASPASVLSAAAEVASLAMMVADNAGGLRLRSELDRHG